METIFIYTVYAFINTYSGKKGYTMVWSEISMFLNLEGAKEEETRMISRMKFNGQNNKNASGYCRVYSQEHKLDSKNKLGYGDVLFETKY